MSVLDTIQFFQLKKIKTKKQKFASKLHYYVKKRNVDIETLEEKQQRIKKIAEKINSKL